MLTHVDLFSGPAGFATGLRAAGVQTIAAVECDAAASATHRLNHPEVPVVEADVREVGGADLLGSCREVSLVSAGIPCQTFSHAGNRSRASFDDRQLLFREAIRLTTEVRATLLLFECVPGIRNKPLEPCRPELVIDLLHRELDAAGFANRREEVLNAAEYGIPQIRKRWFLLASRDRGLSLRFPKPTSTKPVTVRDAFAELPPWTGGDEYAGPESNYSQLLRNRELWRLPTGENRLTHHDAPGHRAATVARYSLLRPGRGVKRLARVLEPEVAAAFRDRRILPNKDFNQRGRRLHPDRTAPTVTGHASEELVHPRANRGITAREAARLQAWPDAYRFAGRLVSPNDAAEQNLFRQIGNSVPPLLAYHLALTIKEMLR